MPTRFVFFVAMGAFLVTSCASQRIKPGPGVAEVQPAPPLVTKRAGASARDKR